jgi:biotin carboxyl carrier protein
MLKITVADSPEPVENSEATETFNLRQEKEEWYIGEDLFDGDMVALDKNRFHIIWKNKSFNVEVIAHDAAHKTAHLLINGVHYHTKAKDRLDLLLEGMGLSNGTDQKLNNIKAPMPGLIQSVAVSEGDLIHKGDTLLILVAMKMENVIKSSGSGVIKSLKVSSGEIVEKNQVLLEFQ